MKALIIYDEFAWALRGSETLQRAEWQAEGRASWELKLWRTDVLAIPSAADSALLEAVDAHLILLAGIQIDLPRAAWLEEWLECWALHRRIEDPALAVIAETSGGGFTMQAPQRLSEFAARHGLSLLFGSEGGFESATQCTVRRSSEPQVFSPPIAPISSFHSSYRDWGINE